MSKIKKLLGKNRPVIKNNDHAKVAEMIKREYIAKGGKRK